MSRLVLSLALALVLCSGQAWAEVSIPVENNGFERPGTGKPKFGIGSPAANVPGWARVDALGDAGEEGGNATHTGSYAAYMGKDVTLFNCAGPRVGTDFLAMDGDVFRLQFWARSTWHGDDLAAQLYYRDDAGNRVVFASADIDLWNSNTLTQYTVDSNAIGLAARDHRVGIQFRHTRVKSTDDNIWAGFDDVTLSVTTPLKRAQSPDPANESSYAGDSVTLAWVPGPNAPAVDRYRVYLSDNRVKVDQGAPEADRGEVKAPTYAASGLKKGATCFWRVDSVIGSETVRGNIWQFAVTSTTAYQPDPAPGATCVALDKVLSWAPGSGSMVGHVVFFGDDLDTVANAPVGLSGPAPFRVWLEQTTDADWSPAEAGLTLETSKTYSWRVDEVEDGESPGIIHKGDVWSFMTVPVKGLGSILSEVYQSITGDTVAELTSDVNYPDNPTSTEYLTAFEIPDRGFFNYGDRTHGYLYIRNTGDYTFWIASGENSQLWLCAEQNSISGSVIAFVDGENGRDGWTNPRQWDKYPEIQQSAPVRLEAGTYYYIMVLRKKGSWLDHLSVAWSGPDTNGTREIIPGTSLIPFDQVELVMAYEPSPANHATEVRANPTLGWKPGEHAVTHAVYFGTDFNSVDSAGTSTTEIYRGSQSEPGYIPGTLAFNTTYYWRVDEVNDAHPDRLWKGAVWSFTTGNFIALDDFEAYDDACNRIFFSWLGGAADSGSQDPNCLRPPYDGNKTGSAVGNYDRPFAEQTVVRSGRQSMPVWYDNTKSPFYSEMAREWPSAQSWTTEGANTLTVYLRGDAPGFMETGAGVILMNGTGTDIWGTSDQFRFVTKPLKGNGSIVAKVESLTNVNSNAKAGVMIRETLNPESMHAFVGITPSAGAEFIRRLTTVGESASDVQAGVVSPYWVKLTRNGDTFTAECSADGVTWASVGAGAAGSSVTIPMGQDVYIGLAVTSRTASTAWVCAAAFSNVTTTGGVTGAWDKVDVGVAQVPGNLPEAFYVAVEDSAGNAQMVSHPDPAVIGTGKWEEWNVPLSQFTSAGVKLNAVKKIRLGIGNPNTPAAGGTGKLYIDDIRLTRVANP